MQKLDSQAQQIHRLSQRKSQEDEENELAPQGELLGETQPPQPQGGCGSCEISKKNGIFKREIYTFAYWGAEK